MNDIYDSIEYLKGAISKLDEGIAAKKLEWQEHKHQVDVLGDEIEAATRKVH